jgi:hypothetical protein
VLIMTNHPRQREMWDGLTRSGCLYMVILLIIGMVIGVLVNGI